MPPNTSQSSFIPKRGATRAKRRKPAKQIFVFALVAYSMVFASLLASGASYLYKNYTTSILQTEVGLLNSEISTFSVSDLSVVSEFDLTLQRAVDRINNSASVASALDAIALSTAQPVKIESLLMERSGDDYVLLTADITAQSFDSALFQRKLLSADPQLFTEVLIEDVSVVGPVDTEQQIVSRPLTNQPVTFTATMQMPIESLPYSGMQPATPTTPSVQNDTLSIPVATDNQTEL